MSRFLSHFFGSSLYIRYNTAANVVNSTYIYIYIYIYIYMYMYIYICIYLVFRFTSKNHNSLFHPYRNHQVVMIPIRMKLQTVVVF